MKLTRLLIVISVISLSVNTVLARENYIPLQDSTIYDTTTVYGMENYIFANVNKTYITTGLLRDYGIDFMNLSNYSGTTVNDSNYVGLGEWRFLYASLYSQQINSTAQLLYLDTLNRLFNNNASPSLPITFTTLYYSYQSLVPNAITSNLMSDSNGQLYDVPGRTQSPYASNDLFAVAPIRQATFVGTNQLLFSSALFFGNSGKTISTIQVDPLGTGSYQTISLNVPFNVTYDSSSAYIVNIRITYTDGTVKLGHTKISVYPTGSATYAADKRQFDPGLTQSGLASRLRHLAYDRKSFIFGTTPENPVNITATKAYQGIYGQGDYTIDLSVNNTTGHIQRPLIVVDGFDPDGSFTYTGQFVYRMDYDINNYPATSIPLNGTSGLDNADSYDIIYLHWQNGIDYIERNAYLLETLIQLVNTDKAAAGSTYQNVVLGFSMGGLIARYALRDMEINNIAHQTRLFICDDAPNWGANVPPALQAGVQELASFQIANIGGGFPFIYFTDLVPGISDGLQLFNSPAAQEMLIQRYTLSGQTLIANNTANTNFMNELNGMGWPLNCKNITLSNGSCNSTKLFPDNSRMIDLTQPLISLSYFADLWRSLELTLLSPLIPLQLIRSNPPISGWAAVWQFPLSLLSTSSSFNVSFWVNPVPPTGTAQIFQGDVYSSRTILGLFHVSSYFIKCHVNSVSGMLPLDNAPGSKYNFLDATGSSTQLTSFLTQYPNLILQPSFCFIPTVSALAISNPSQNLLTNVCATANCLNPTQVADYYAQTANQDHVSFTTANSNWLLEEQAASFSCAKICPTSLAINGESAFCTTSTAYTLSNLPVSPGITSYTWSTSPSNLVTINSPSADQTTLTSVAGGVFTLNAALTGGCAPNQNITVSKTNISVNNPPAPTISITGIEPLNHGTEMDVSVSTIESPPYLWYVNGTLAGTEYTSSATINGGSNCNVLNTLKVTVSNSCGTTSVSTQYTRPCTGSNYLIAPNPSKGTVTVSATNSSGTQMALKSSPAATTLSGENSIYQIRVIDQLGNVRKLFSYSSGVSSAQLDLSTLLDGTYTIQIFNNAQWVSQQIIILK